MSDATVVDGAWLRSWWAWPRELVSDSVRDQAAAWGVGVLVCACSRERVSAWPVAERRGLVAVFAATMRRAVGRSVLLPSGRRAAFLVQSCVGGPRCGRAQLVRVEFAWPE